MQLASLLLTLPVGAYAFYSNGSTPATTSDSPELAVSSAAHTMTPVSIGESTTCVCDEANPCETKTIETVSSGKTVTLTETVPASTTTVATTQSTSSCVCDEANPCETKTIETVSSGKTVTLTETVPASTRATPDVSSPAATATATPCTGCDEDMTTYVTVVEGKTITVTSHKSQPTPAPQQPPALSDEDLTTYVTVVLGKTMTITTARTPSAIGLANGANAARGGAAAALVAGALYLL